MKLLWCTYESNGDHTALLKLVNNVIVLLVGAMWNKLTNCNVSFLYTISSFICDIDYFSLEYLFDLKPKWQIQAPIQQEFLHKPQKWSNLVHHWVIFRFHTYSMYLFCSCFENKRWMVYTHQLKINVFHDPCSLATMFHQRLYFKQILKNPK